MIAFSVSTLKFFHFQVSQFKIVCHAVTCEYKSITRMRLVTKKKCRGLKSNERLHKESTSRGGKRARQSKKLAEKIRGAEK